MRILFIADPLDHFKLYKDTTFAMMQEAAARGHALSFAEAHQLSVEGGRVLVDARDLSLTGQNAGEHPAWFKLGELHRQPLQAFSAVVMRKDPPFDMEYLYASQLFTLAEAQGARCSPAARPCVISTRSWPFCNSGADRADADHRRIAPAARLRQSASGRDPEAAGQHGRR